MTSTSRLRLTNLCIATVTEFHSGKEFHVRMPIVRAGNGLHFECIGIKTAPKGSWYCDVCGRYLIANIYMSWKSSPSRFLMRISSQFDRLRRASPPLILSTLICDAFSNSQPEIHDLTEDDWRRAYHDKSCEKMQRLGDGSSGTVHRCRLRKQEFALKTISADPDAAVQRQIIRELSLNGSCRSQYIAE